MYKTHSSNETLSALLSVIFMMLDVLLVLLKLTGVIHCSWLWVLAPIWIPALIKKIIIVVTFLILLPVEMQRRL